MSGTSKTGSCLCGGVRYRLSGKLRGVSNCFCGQCRKTSGHHVAATRVQRTDFHLLNERTLRWYHSSKKARRGFCSECGSSLFWQANDSETISIMAGTLDLPTGLATTKNIYVADASDYQIIPDLK